MTDPKLKELVFCPLDISISEPEIHAMTEEISAHKGFYSSYRTCEMIPLYTPGGETQRQAIISSKSAYQWTPIATQCPITQRFIKEKIFPLTDPLPRIIVLKSLPGAEVKVHTDCSRESADDFQHKIRIALSGDLAGLWFLSKKNKRIHISGKHHIYMLDGSTPHGAINDSSQPKITICLGSPWSGDRGAKYQNLLLESAKKFADQIIRKDQVFSPEDFLYYQDEMNGIEEHRPSAKKMDVEN
jgi:hypothetical protein